MALTGVTRIDAIDRNILVAGERRLLMGANPLLGVFFHWLGGLASASFYLRSKRVERWSSEIFWITGGMFSWLVAPWLFAFASAHNDLLGVLGAAPGQTPGSGAGSGAPCGGSGGLTFWADHALSRPVPGHGGRTGLRHRLWDLGTANLPGYLGDGCLPPRGSGKVTMVGVLLITLVGILIVAKAGQAKDAEAQQRRCQGKKEWPNSTCARA